MPRYTGRINEENKLVMNHRDKIRKWTDKRRGLWVEIDMKVIGKGKDRDKKTTEQLGYYWGLLNQEILAELLRRGFTKTYRGYGGIENIVPIDKEDAHRITKQFCGYVGEDGAKIDMSDMDKDKARLFIDYVISWMVSELGMNEKELKARRPK